MTIRKTGSVTGEITGIEEDGPLSKSAARRIEATEWRSADEQALADENREVDFHDPDERRAE